ncbi:MAG: hypothetical protein ACTSR1_01020 [Candidatus Heimdallarchaeota archaeon]
MNKGIKQASRGSISKGTIVIRMYLKDFRKIKRIFKAERDESAASYFERLAKWLEEKK